MSSNTTPAPASQANQNSSNAGGKKRNAEEENNGAKRLKTTSVEEGADEFVDISIRSVKDIMPALANMGAYLKDIVDSALEAEKKKTAEAAEQLATAQATQFQLVRQKDEAESRVKRSEEASEKLVAKQQREMADAHAELFTLQVTNNKLEAENKELRGASEELRGLKEKLAFLLQGHGGTPTAVASGVVAPPIGAGNAFPVNSTAVAAVSPAASSPTSAKHHKPQSTAVDWTAENMRDLYYAVQTVPKKALSPGKTPTYDWKAISEHVPGCYYTNGNVAKNKWNNSKNKKGPGGKKLPNPIEGAFIGERVVLVSGDLEQEMIGRVVAFCAEDGLWEVHFNGGKEVKNWSPAELARGWHLYKEQY